MALDFPSNPTVGQTFNDYVWTGVAWAAQGSTNNVGTQIAALQTFDNNTVGLARVVPTSITAGGGSSSASYTAKGDITYTTVTSLTVNGIFSSRFTNYLIVWNNTFGSANPDVTMQWTSNGTASTTGYFRSGLRVNQSGTIQNYYSAGSSDGHVLATGENGYNLANIRGNITVYNPFGNDSTTSMCDAYGTFTPTGFQRYLTGAGHDNVSRDGFRILSSSGTLSGKFAIYGYN